jgi:hypothetical protein
VLAYEGGAVDIGACLEDTSHRRLGGGVVVVVVVSVGVGVAVARDVSVEAPVLPGNLLCCGEEKSVVVALSLVGPTQCVSPARGASCSHRKEPR